jgi:hypothetical protein
MLEKISELKLLRGLSNLGFRLPIWPIQAQR